MKISRFSKFYAVYDNVYLAYSTRTNALFEVTSQLFKYLTTNGNKYIDTSYFEESVLNNLLKSKIIVPETEDDIYVKELQFKTLQYNFSQEWVSLIIAPTTKCNFRCFYCFELNKNQKLMDDDTVSNLIKFINRHENAKNISITWYGGEPLLALERIEQILEEVKRGKKTLTNHEIITNGYFFNEKAIDLFSKYPLNKIQITLDGNKERHDSIRCDYKTREVSFEQILANMELILTHLPDTLLSIRINIEKKTQKQYEEVKNYLTKRFEKYSNYHIYPGILRIDNETGDDLSKKAMSITDTALFSKNLCECGSDNYPKYINKSCTASRVNAYVIGPNGEIYKCWNDVTDASKIVATIEDDKIIDKQLLYDYLLSTLWFENENCINCSVLPICHGGCPWYKERNLRKNGHFNACSIYKNDEFLKSSIISRYKQELINKR